MSDALNYLVKARPEAMGHYFRFLKDAGSQLDPKTRALISVITKVHAQTERGLKQYLGRALREGCSAAEILDALLMAFPALGLAKIVWATDVILSMNLPEFSIEALGGEPDWHDLLASDSLPVNATTRIECDGRALFVHHGRDGFQVYDSRCPHRSTDIPELAIDGQRLTCPKHGWVFDIASGDCVDKGDTPLRRYESRVQDGRLQASW